MPSAAQTVKERAQLFAQVKAKYPTSATRTQLKQELGKSWNHATNAQLRELLGGGKAATGKSKPAGKQSPAIQQDSNTKKIPAKGQYSRLKQMVVEAVTDYKKKNPNATKEELLKAGKAALGKAATKSKATNEVGSAFGKGKAAAEEKRSQRMKAADSTLKNAQKQEGTKEALLNQAKKLKKEVGTIENPGSLAHHDGSPDRAFYFASTAERGFDKYNTESDAISLMKGSVHWAANSPPRNRHASATGQSLAQAAVANGHIQVYRMLSDKSKDKLAEDLASLGNPYEGTKDAQLNELGQELSARYKANAKGGASKGRHGIKTTKPKKEEPAKSSDSTQPNEVVTARYYKKAAELNSPKYEKLSQVEKASLLAYTDGGFSFMNPAIRGLDDQFKKATERTSERTGLSQEQLKRDSLEAAKSVNTGIRKVEPIKDATVYRGMGEIYNVERAMQLKVGDELPVDKAPQSTSKDKSVAQSFGNNVVFVVKTSQGRDVSDIAGRSQEKELLIPGGSKFKVAKVVVTEKSRLSGKPRKVEVHLEDA